MAIRIQNRRGTASEWSAVNPVLADGEAGYERDTGVFKVGDGVTAWNSLKPAGNSTYAPLSGTLRAPRTADLTYPLVMAHRSAGNLFPQGCLYSYEHSAALPAQVLDIGDYRMLSDGAIADVHDTTVDLTTDGSGPVTSFTTPGIKRLNVDASVWFGGGWPDGKVPLLTEVLARTGGLTIIQGESKDGPTTSAAICRQVKAAGLQDSFILNSFNLGDLTVPEAAGIYTSLNFGTGTLSGITAAQAVAAGVDQIQVDLTAPGDHVAFLAPFKAAGIRALAYTVDHQSGYDLAMSLGYDGIASNDPVYAARNYAAYRKTATAWHVNGTWGHGMLVAGTGPFTAAQRGSFVGAAGAWRWKVPNNQFCYPGEINPVASPAGTYTVTTKFVVEAIPSNTAQGACLFVGAPVDTLNNIAGNIPSSYQVKARASGQVQAWKVDAAGTSFAFAGSLTTTAWAIPTLSAGLTSGVAVTSLPVNALTVAVKAGHQFVLPTGQVATASGAAAVAATAIPVNSITPSGAVASGANLLPQITLKATVTPTTVTFSRDDEAAVGTLSSTDSAFRGGYVVGMHLTDNGGMSFASFAVS